MTEYSTAELSDTTRHGVILKDIEDRLAALEKKTLLKRLSGLGAGLALVLGLVATAISVYGGIFTQPEIARIDQIAQFNAAVSSAAKTGEETQMLLQDNPSKQDQFTAMSFAQTLISTDIATADAMLQDLQTQDVGIPQLIVLTDAAFNEGDPVAAKRFVDIAMSKTDASPFLRSEAEREEGKYYFQIGQPAQGHEAYQAAIGDVPNVMGKAYDLGEATRNEFGAGDCDDAMADTQSFADLLNAPGFPESAKGPLLAVERTALENDQGSPCPVQDAENLLPQ